MSHKVFKRCIMRNVFAASRARLIIDIYMYIREKRSREIYALFATLPGVDGSVRGNKTKVDDMHNIMEDIKLATSRRKSKLVGK